MPRSCGLMRPSGTIAAASVNTRPATLEYWHIGDTKTRLGNVTPRTEKGSKRCGMTPVSDADERAYRRDFVRVMTADGAAPTRVNTLHCGPVRQTKIVQRADRYGNDWLAALDDFQNWSS